jgi:ASC-1-like (ASCH) protein
MITASGAEGLSLMNTCFVHIVEPYWNWVRLEQVIGRARRICSHQDLPEELRTVRVFVYLSVYSQAQLDKNRSGEGVKEVETYDASKRQKDNRGDPVVFTTDQMLLEIAQTKDEQNQVFLNAVKETAMDCVLYQQNGPNARHCFSFRKSKPTALAFQPSLEEDLTELPEVAPLEKIHDKKTDLYYRIDRNEPEQKRKGRYVLYDNAAYEQGRIEPAGKEFVEEKDPTTGKIRRFIQSTL